MYFQRSVRRAFVLRMADGLARRIEREAGPRVETQVERAYQLLFTRAADEEERQLATELAREHGLAVLCRALVNSGEFVTVE